VSRIKQVILVRKDLKMRRGKEVAQGAHAAMQFLVQPIAQLIQDPSQTLQYLVKLTADDKVWITQGMAKVCLRVNSEQELLECHQQALAAGLKSYLIVDSGRTEFHGHPTHTACAIGPDDASRIDVITGHLQPY